MSLFRRALRSGQGQATVEFALTVPLILMLLLGALDFGRALTAHVTVSNAAREGLRYAARAPSPTADVAAVVRARSAPLDTTLLVVTTEYSNDDGANWVAWSSGGSGAILGHDTVVRVTVTYPWSALTQMIGAFIAAGSGSATLMVRATGIAEATRE